jgi:acetyl-CoA synthetase
MYAPDAAVFTLTLLTKSIQTYWQTETGSHAITPLGGVTSTKPGSASLPFFGIDPAIIDPVSGEEVHGNDVEGVLAFRKPWPSMARTVWGAHKRYLDTYLNVYKGYYVSATFLCKYSVDSKTLLTFEKNSSLVMVLVVITRATIGSVAVLMMS